LSAFCRLLGDALKEGVTQMNKNVLKLAAVGIIAWSPAALAAVDSYITELSLIEPGVDGIKTVVFEWSTSETSGMINANELVDYSVSLYAGSSLLYRDDVLVDGVLQPLNSVDRDYPFWDFDLDTLTLRQFTPGSIGILTSGAVTGTHYHVADWASLPQDSIVYVQKFVDGFQSDWSISLLSSQRTFRPVAIDIKPGSDPNCLNINGRGVIPVAVLSDQTFDAATIDITTLSLGGLDVRVRGNKGPLCSLEDANGDGLNDMVCQFQDDPDYWDVGEDEATLKGKLVDGIEIEGTDLICIVPYIVEA
jgi:hypothetical protein